MPARHASSLDSRNFRLLGLGAMPEWEYRTLDLNDLPRKTEVVDVLNNAGENGWELVTITPNQIAYLAPRRELRILSGINDLEKS